MDFEHNNLDQVADATDQNDRQDLENFTDETSFDATMNLQAVGSIPALQTGTQNTVVLPDGVELDDIRVVGRDLVITLPDGSNMVIPDGAVFIPQFVIDGVSVPPLNLAALLVGNEPQPAAGPPQSSGGNFADPVGDIGDPFALGDLLPPTALAFTESQQDEIFPFEPDEDDAVPNVVIVTPENPAGSASATSSVDESGLPARGAEPEGTDAAGNGETTAGTIIFNPGDEPSIVSIVGVSVNGVAITAVGQTVQGTFGTLTITSINDGSIGYSYTLSDNTDGNDTSDFFEVSVVDADGDRAAANLTINIIDDAPVAVDDLAISVSEDAPGTVGGNVLTNDTQGADGAIVTSVTIGELTTSINAVGTTVVVTANGIYSFAADGTWTFDPNPNLDQSVGDIDASFAYTITDGDDDIATATQPISITDGADPVAGVPITLTLDDQNLADGTTPAGPDFVTANIAFTAGSDAISSIVFGTDLSALSGGLTWERVDDNTITGSDGANVVVTLTLSVSANVATVTATLNDNYDSHPVIAADDLQSLGSVTVIATDTDGDTAAGTVNINMSDDVPSASDEVSQDVNEGAKVSGTLDFVQGADGASVTHINGAALVFSSGAAEFSDWVDIGAGMIRVKADGSYEFTADDPTISPVTPTMATFTVTDADGDTATANVSFQIVDANVPTAGTSAAEVDDDGLAGGNPASTKGDQADANTDNDNDETTFSGTLALDFGGDGAGTADFASMDTLTATLGQETVTYSWLSGTLTATITGGARDGIALFTVEVTNAATGAYTVTLLDNVLHAQGPNDENDASVSLNYNVTDADGSVAAVPGTLNITFNDDAPTVVLSGATVPTLVTDDTDTPDEVATAVSFAGLFTPSFGADGFKDADGNDIVDADAVTYALGIAGVDGMDSGLVDTLTGDAILLRTVGNKIEGYLENATGTVAFTITLDVNAGTVSLEQDRAIAHNDPFDPVEAGASAATLASSLITLTATVTDGDGDQATSNTVNIGGAFQFLDDGPTIDVTKGTDAGVVLTTQDANTDGAPSDTDTAVSTANFSGVFGLTSTSGADGAIAPSLSYALGLASGVAEGDPSGLTIGGTAINLYTVGGVIVGSTALTAPASATDASVVFSIAVASDGVVTLSQLQQIDHPIANDPSATEAPFNDDIISLADGLVELTASSSITDGDGDTASDSETVDLGGNIRFIDDGPDAVLANATAAMVVVDESPVAPNGDGIVSATGNFAGNFAAVTDYGTDGAGSVSYALNLTGINVASGLFALDNTDVVDTDGDGIGQGASIVLNQTNATTITGSVGATVYFTISVDAATGVVTFAQNNNIWHGNTASDDEAETLTLANANILTLTQTVTDADGDSDSASLNLGTGVFKIEDDGPDAVLANATAAMVVVDESPVAPNGDGIVSATGNFAGNFAAVTDYGTDGAGSVSYALNLTGINVASGLFALDNTDVVDTDGDGIGQGASIVLNQTNATTITGSVGATVYFTISVDAATGVVTFAQNNNIWHGNTASDDEAETLTLANANILTLTQTVTDADGDSDSASLNLGTGVFKIEDDGPDAVLANATAAMVVVDESPVAPNGDGIVSATGNFAGNFAAVTDYGTDGAGSVSYALNLTGINVASGLFALDNTDVVDTDGDGIGQGASIVLNQTNATTITGSVGATVYFTISVDAATGVVTFAQNNNIWHGNTASDDEAETLTLANANILTLTQTVTDADGDSDSASLNLGTGVFKIEDDGPDAVLANATAAMVVVDESPVAPNGDGIVSATGNFAGNFAAVTDYGTDGAGSVSYALNLTGINVASGLFALDNTDVVDTDGDGIGQGASIVLNQTNATTITGSVGATVYFTISVDAATGVVTFAQNNNIWHGNTASDDEAETLTLANANILTLTQTVTDADGDSDSASLNLGTGVFKIEDDGPDAVLANATAAMVVVDESPVAPNGDGIVSATGNFAGNFAAVTDYGTDGAGSVSYALNLTGINVASGLFALDNTDVVDTDGDGIGQGASIVLNQTNATTITGSVGATVYFTISVDAATGVVTFAQNNNIWHGNTASDDEAETLTLANANILTLTQTVTDADGDSDSASLNLGTGVFKIEDDGPDAVLANATAAMVVVDESPVAPNGDGIVSATGNFAGNFAAVTDYGTDGAGSVSYALNLTGINVASGLFALDNTDVVDTDGDGIGQGASIVLNQTNATTITGSVGATVYFTISVDAATGVVTFAQNNNIWHGNTASDDEAETLTLANANILTLTQTVTDADGDSDSASLNLGTGVFKIEDDGPDAVLANATAAMVVVDESPVAPNGDGIVSATGNFAGNFAAVTDYGTDGAGSVSYALNLTGINVASGLFALDNTDVVDTDGDGIGQGASIVLNQTNATTITGSVGATVYFTISVDAATGVVTFAQNNNIWHGNTASDDEAETLTLANANILTLTQTVTDADGDSDSASLNLGTGVFKIEDDGPDAVLANATAAMVVVDESPVAPNGDGIVSATGNFAGNFAAVTDYGTDGAGSVSYALNLTGINVASGLFALDNTDVVDTDGDGIGQGASIVLNQTNATTITGSVGATVYFTISVDAATGVVTFAQNNNIWHGNTASDDEAETLTLANANILTLTQTVTDADGDSDSASLNLGTGVFKIEDDGPDAVLANATAAMVVVDESPVAPNGDGIVSATGNFAGNFAAVTDYGTDGAGSVSYALNLTGINVASGLFALDNTDVVDTDGDGIGQGASIVLNQTNATTITGSVGATVYFTISVDAATGVVTFAQNNNIWHGNTASDDEAETLTLANANILTLTQTVTDADGDSDSASLNLGTGVFKIEDDGPDAVLANATAAMVVVDESPVAPNGDGIVSATGNFAGNFAAVTDYGTDGAGSVSYALNLTGINVASGLFALDNTDVVDTDGDGIGQGASIVLNQTNATTITGSVGATVYFTISVDAATGVVTFAQNNNIWHGNTASDDEAETLTLANANILTLTQTVTDADGDSDSASLNLGTGVFKIEDDGPDAVLANATAAMVVVDESPVAPNGDGIVSATGNFAGNFAAVTDYGTDGAGSVSYALNLTGINVASGLFALDNTDVVDTDGDGIGQGASIVLNQTNATTITGSVGATVYFTISVDAATGVVTFAQNNNIWHGNTASDDEAETLTLANANILTLTQTVTDADGDSDSASLNLGTGVFKIEDDGPTLTTADDLSVPNSITSYTGNFVDFDYGTDLGGGITLKALTDITGIVYSGQGTDQITATVNGNDYFTLTVNQVTGEYVLDVLTERPVVETPLSFSNIAPGNYETVTLPGGQIFDGVSFANGTTSPQQFTNDTSTINPSGNGFGIANNLVNDNEGFLFSNQNSSSLEFDVKFQPNTSQVTITYATYVGGTPTGGATPQQTGTLVVNTDADGIVHVELNPNMDFDHIVVRFDYTGSGNQAVRVQDFSVTQQVIPDDQVLQFEVTITDADGDAVVSTVLGLGDSTIDITFEGGPPVPPPPLAPMAPLAPINFLGFENEPAFQSSDNGEWLSSNDNGGLMFQNANGLGENVALIEPVNGETTSQPKAVEATPVAKAMLANSNEAQSARAAVKAPTTSQIVIAATLLAANSQPEESTGGKHAPLGELGNNAALEVNSVQNQAQPEAVPPEGVQAASDEAASKEHEAASGGNSTGSEEPTVETGIAEGSEMIVEESSGNNDAQPGFDATEFQSASGLHLDMGIAMNMEALARVDDAPLPVQLDITAPETPPADLEEIVADAIDGGLPETVTIDAVIESFAGSENGGGRGAIEHMPDQALPEHILDMFVHGDAGPLANGVSDGMQTQIDMAEAGHASG